MLIYFVKGSAAQPYKVTFDGAGESLRVFCSCPAGRKGGVFCKHIAALALGDVTHLADGSDDPAVLPAIVGGSGITAKAASHKPKAKYTGQEAVQIAYEQTGSIAAAIAEDIERLKARGWRIEAGADAVSCHGWFKNGKARASGAAMLSFQGRDVIYPGGVVAFGNRERPFSANGHTFAYLEPARLKFLELAAEAEAKHLPQA